MKTLIGCAVFLCAATLVAAGEPNVSHTETNVPVEISFEGHLEKGDPFNDVTLDVLFTDPTGTVRRVPAFWAGGTAWKVRYASPIAGKHTWLSECSGPPLTGLHGVSGVVEIAPYHGTNPLYRHGPIRAAADKRHLEHLDGTPFFWLGDTWWMGLCHRLHFPDEFAKLAADRKAKGFTVIQIVAGLYPDMHPFDPRGANEAGFPWEKEYARIRPEYFDAADARLKYLIEQGMSPCIVGAWGYFLPWTGQAKMKAHWRYLVARYGAYPVSWCVAGEANLPWYLAPGFPYDDRKQVTGWTDVAAYLRATDPYHRLTTIHPTGMGPLNARHAIDDAALLDFDMLQTPHGENGAVAPTVRAMLHAYAATPPMPVLNGEASYEMLSDKIAAEWPRKMFWLCMMNGAAGHTYGANGIWQCNRKGEPHGKSPHGGSYGVIPWDEAMNLPGSTHVSLGKVFFETLPWQKLIPMADSVQWADVPESPTAINWGDWIWYPEGDPKRDAPIAVRYFRATFSMPDNASVQRAHLHITADDNFTVWINGHEAGHGANWHAPMTVDIAKLLTPGRNSIAVRAENVKAPVKENPAGLNASAVIKLSNGETITLVSNDKWRAAKSEFEGWRVTEFDDSKWPQALAAAHYGDAPWGRFEPQADAFVPYALGIGTETRVIYAIDSKPVLAKALSPNAKYVLVYFNPLTGERTTPAMIESDREGNCVVPAPAFGHDWVGLIEGPANPSHLLRKLRGGE